MAQTCRQSRRGFRPPGCPIPLGPRRRQYRDETLSVSTPFGLTTILSSAIPIRRRLRRSTSETTKIRGRGVQVQPLESFQQRNHSRHVPVLADPNFRSVVFEKQRHARLQTRLDPGPGEAAIALVNKIDGIVFDLSKTPAEKIRLLRRSRGRARGANRLGIDQR